MLVLALLLACPQPDPDPEPDTEGTETADSGPPPCGTAGQTLPEGLVELALDDGTAEGSQADRPLSIYGVSTADSPSRHGVRFELENPALVHGFKVQWTDVPDEGELTARLSDDFGYNGFDFWYDVPLWEGTRCVEDHQDGQWLVYAFDEPIEVAHPGLLFVTATREPGGPSMAVDFTDVDQDWYTICADGFDVCSGTMNFPELNDGSLEYGITVYTQMHFMARLQVEYTRTDPELFFEDVGSELGLSSRFSWGDYDNDGWDDLYSGGSLFHNNEGTLEAVAGPTASSSGGVWGDYDNDGCLDLFVFLESTAGSDTLWKGDCEGGFTDVTESAGGFDDGGEEACDGEANTHAPSPAAAWWDIDSDGDLDLYVPNFICWGNGATYTDHVWINNEGTFTKRVGDNGLSPLPYAGRGAAPADADGDGDVDLMVNNYRLHKNLYYRNEGDGLVKEYGGGSRLAGDGGSLAYGHTIGVAWGDLDNDGYLDQVQGNLAHPRWFSFSDKSMVLMNPGPDDNKYVDLAGDWEEGPYGDAGLRYQETHSVPTLADFDNDGVLDLVISAVYEGRPTDFYWGVGDGTFVLDAYDAGIQVTNGWGHGASDVNNDGHVDLAARGAMLMNRRDDGRAWLQVRAVGNVDSNWGAYGATVRVTDSEGQTRIRHVQGGTGQGCQDSAYLHFGLADATGVESIQVDFPGGETVTFEGPWDTNQRVWVYEDGTHTVGSAP
jgi:enediyne biosynthesis protein E4